MNIIPKTTPKGGWCEVENFGRMQRGYLTASSTVHLPLITRLLAFLGLLQPANRSSLGIVSSLLLGLSGATGTGIYGLELLFLTTTESYRFLTSVSALHSKGRIQVISTIYILMNEGILIWLPRFVLFPI